MAVLPRQTTAPAPSASALAADQTAQVYLSAALLATISLIIMLLIIPPMIWHFRNRNIGATMLVAWVIMLLFFTFVNAILWPNDDLDHWYNGVGLCDVEVKIQVASQVAFPASMACILRALAAVMDTDNVTLTQTRAQRRRKYVIDLSWCVGFPLLQMLLHYVVQSRRYYLYGIAGCVPAVSKSVVTIFLLVVPPMIWTLIDSYYSVLVLIRLYRYRLSISSVLACNNTTKSRFMCLYIICIMWIFGYIPLQAYTLYINIAVLAKEPYSWSGAHDPVYWNEILMTPSGGKVLYDRWIWLTCGLVVFVFFGFGRDAVNMYRSGLLAIGLGKVIPSLKSDSSSSYTGSSFSSFGSKAKMLFKRKSTTSDSTWSSGSQTSQTLSPVEPILPKKMTSAIESIDEKQPSPSGKQPPASQDKRISGSNNVQQSYSSRLPQNKRTQVTASPIQDLMPLAALNGPSPTVETAMTSGPQSPTISQHVGGISSEEILVRMEVKQGSRGRSLDPS